MRAFARTLYRSLILLLFATAAQAQVTVILRQPPPNQLRIADLWQITVVNPTDNTYLVYLRGTARHDRDGIVVDATSDRFVLAPNATKVVNGNDVSPIKVDSSNKRYQDILMQTGAAPSGRYEICVYVNAVAVNGTAQQPEIIGEDCVSGHEVHQSTPPILVYPYDKSEVTEKLPLFTWLPPAPPKPGQQVRYQLRIVEILGRQSPYDAMASNPAWFKREGIVGNQQQYPLSARSFRDETDYAWQIKAIGDGYTIGESEIWSFRYNPTAQSTGEQGGMPILPGGGIDLPVGGGDGTGSESDKTKSNYNDDGIPIDRDALILLDSLTDRRAVRWRKNIANETMTAGALCSARPTIAVVDSLPPLSSFPKWPGEFRLRWIIRTATPIDHIDMRIFRAVDDSLLRHFIYRPREGELPSGTVIDPATLFKSPQSIEPIIIRTVAVDRLGRASRLGSRRITMLGAERGMVETLPSGEIAGAGSTGDEAHRDTIIIGNQTREGRPVTVFSTTELSVRRSSRSVTLANNDVVPHHFRSVYTPTYIEFNPPLGPGSVPRLDFGRLGPGETRTIPLPEELPTCYTWTLYDMENPTPTNRLRITVNAVDIKAAD